MSPEKPRLPVAMAVLVFIVTLIFGGLAGVAIVSDRGEKCP
jgi:hypothetical protein